MMSLLVLALSFQLSSIYSPAVTVVESSPVNRSAPLDYCALYKYALQLVLFMARLNNYRQWYQLPWGKKRRVLCNTRRCDQDCRPAYSSSQLKAVVINWSGQYAGIIGFNLFGTFVVTKQHKGLSTNTTYLIIFVNLFFLFLLVM